MTTFDMDELCNEFGGGIAEVVAERGERPATVAVGSDGATAYRFADGTRVIGTNGDPLLDETADGFDDKWSEIVGD